MDQVVVHHREMAEVKIEGDEEVERVEDQTTTGANETCCARNDKKIKGTHYKTF